MYELKISARDSEIASLKEYSGMLEEVILKIERRMNNNKQELAKCIQYDIQLDNESVCQDLKSQVMNSVVQLADQELVYAATSPIKPSHKISKLNQVEALNINTIPKSKLLNMPSLKPNYLYSATKLGKNESSIGFIDEIKKLNNKYNKQVCSLENFSDFSSLANQEVAAPAKNSLNNGQFQTFVKILADRIKDRYEENINEKVFGN